MPSTLTVAAVCVRDPAGRLLTVRKRDTARFMLPGGKLEPGESPAHAAIRELAEEVGLDASTTELVLLGQWHAPAANEPDTAIDSTVFSVAMHRPDPRIANEIAELRWLDLADADALDDLAPMLTLYVIPALRTP